MSTQTNGKRTTRSNAARSTLKTIVVVADYAFVNGGNGQVGLSSAVALAHAGFDVVLFSSSGPVGDIVRNVPRLRVVCLHQPEFLSDPNRARGALRGLWNFKAAKAFRSVLAELDPATTIIHVHSWTKALSSSVAAIADHSGFSVVVTIHDYFAFCPNGSLYDHAKQEPCLLRPMSAACIGANCDPRSRSQKMYRVVRQLLTDRVAGMPKDVKYFICVSPFSRAIAEPYLKGGRIFEIDNPIEATHEPAADPGANDEFVYVGRLSREKGTDIFALAALLADAPTAYVGDGPLATSMKQMAPKAEFTGWLDRDAVRDRIRHARALVLPSRWYEASPLVVPEAASLGIPSIVADRCAASRSIVDGVTGLTFRSGDAVDLSEKIAALSDPTLARLMGKAAYDRFWAAPPLMRYHVEALCRSYETILMERTPALD